MLMKSKVPPYRSRVETIRPPWSARLRIVELMAAIPEEKATAATPPSSEARRPSRTSGVGLPTLEYRCAPGSKPLAARDPRAAC